MTKKKYFLQCSLSTSRFGQDKRSRLFHDAVSDEEKKIFNYVNYLSEGMAMKNFLAYFAKPLVTNKKWFLTM